MGLLFGEAGAIKIQAVSTETETMDSEITEHAVDIGQPICDHIEAKPITFTASGIVIAGDIVAAKDTLRKMWEAGKPLRYNGRGALENVAIESMSISEDATAKNGFYVSLSLKKIRTVELQELFPEDETADPGATEEVHLYASGNEAVAFSQVNSANVSMTKESDHLKCNVESSAVGPWHGVWGCQYDLTDFSTLTVEYRTHGWSPDIPVNHGINHIFQVGVSSSAGYGGNQGAASFDVWESVNNIYMPARAILTVDISSITGSNHVKFLAYDGSRRRTQFYIYGVKVG